MTTPLEPYPLVIEIRQRLDDGLPSSAAAYHGAAPQGAVPPYVVLYFDVSGESSADRTLSDGVPNDLRFQATTVGANADQTMLIAGKADTVLRTMTPTVPGRRVRSIRQEGSQTVRRDEVSTALFIATAQYLARSERT